MADDSKSTHKRGGLIVEYAKSGRAQCKGCENAIASDSIRVGKETPSDYHDGFDTSWFHYKCCNKKKGGGPSFTKIEELKEWETLRWDDQVKIKNDVGQEVLDTPEEKKREEENRRLWEIKDDLADNLKNKDLKTLLEANGHTVGKMTADRLIHKCADGMLLGNIGPCPECKGTATLRWNGFEYYCKMGWISAHTRCEFRGTKGVSRFKWKIPSELKSTKFFKNWEYPEGHPKNTKPEGGEEDKVKEGKEEEADEDGKSKKKGKKEEEEESDKEPEGPEEEVPEGLEMWGITCVLAGTKKDLGMTQDELTELITEHGGQVTNDVDAGVTVMIATEAELNKKKKTVKVSNALKQKIPILSVDFVTNLCERNEEGIKLRQNENAKEYLIEGAKMGDHPIAKKYTKARYDKEQAKLDKEEEEEEEEEEDKPRVIKRKRLEPKQGSDILKVDEDTGYTNNNAEIVVTEDDQYGYTPYNVMLNVSDISTGTNKYYKMQVLKIKNKKKWVFFIKYGRIGTDVGDSKVYDHGSEAKAIQAFVDKFFDRTANKWENRDIFEKKPGKYFMAEVDDGNDEPEDEEIMKSRIKRVKKDSDDMDIEKNSKKSLPNRVQELVHLIFDQKMMIKTLETMNVDVNKMPLGKIKKSQISEGYKVLTEIQNLIESGEEKEKMDIRLKDATNRFYTLMPHKFDRGVKPPIISDIEAVKTKMNLLDTLGDIEIAASLMKGDDTDDSTLNNYNKLNAEIHPIEKDSKEYKLLETYAYDTHDNNYFSKFNFTVEDIFTISRDGEDQKFEPWKENDNRMLLWHGSRLTNWVGIISQGLRIAPPEAPKTGYRFGKGVYFADVISKSGSYCFTSNDSPHAVMLLAEVALGNLNSLKQDTYMEKAPKGTHSTKALGQFAPNEKTYEKLNGTDITVPVGKVVSTGIKSMCSHNEYIVYDTAQIHIRYLVRLKFKHKN